MTNIQTVRQRDELRIRIQHLMHLLHDSQTAFDDQTKENNVLRHALLQAEHKLEHNIQSPIKVTNCNPHSESAHNVIYI